jgi:hypothetical protein
VADLAVGEPGGRPGCRLAGIPVGLGRGGGRLPGGIPQRVRSADRAVAQRAVEASGRRPRRGGGGRMARRIVRRSREVALRTDRGVRRVRGRVGIRGASGAAPRLGRMRRTHPVAGVAGDLRTAAGEVAPVADPAGGEPGASRGFFRGYAVILRRGRDGDPAGNRTVVTAGGVAEAGDPGDAPREIRTVTFRAGAASAVGDVVHRGGIRVRPAGGGDPSRDGASGRQDVVRRRPPPSRGIGGRTPGGERRGHQEQQTGERPRGPRFPGTRHYPFLLGL